MKRIRGSALFAVLISMAVLSCSSDTPDTGVVVRDSAGITIVESYEGSWGPDEGWSLSPEPVVSIGTADGPEEYSLHGVSAAFHLPDSRYVIVNSGTDELRYYDSSGSHLYSVGRDGFGPGEFKQVFGTWQHRDTLILFDFGKDRVDFFSVDGAYGRTVMLDRPRGIGMAGVEGVFSDGSLLAMAYVRGDPLGSGPSARRMDAVYWRSSPEGEILDSVGAFFKDETIAEITSSEGNTARGIVSEAPFGRSASMIAHGIQLYYASSESYEIRVFDLAGTIERIVRRPIPNESVNADDIRAFKEDFLSGDPRFNAWARRTVDMLEYPDSKPAYGTVEVDALGNIWVAEFSLGLEDRSGKWTVFDTDGRMLGVVEVPPGGRRFEIGADYLIGVWRDELDVSYVRMYRIFKDRR